MKTTLQRLIAIVLLTAAGSSIGGGPDSFQFDIPAGSLKDSMEKYAATIGGDVVFDAFAARDVHTQPVRGSMSPESALNQMLAGTGLSYSYNAVARRVIVSSRRN